MCCIIYNTQWYTFNYITGIYIVTGYYSFYGWESLDVLCLYQNLIFGLFYIYFSWRLNSGPRVCEACFQSTKLLVQPPTFKCLNKINTPHTTFAFCEVYSQQSCKPLKRRGKMKELGDTEKPITKIKGRIFTGEKQFHFIVKT